VRLVDPSERVLACAEVESLENEVLLEARESGAALAGLQGRLVVDDPHHPVIFAELWNEALARRWTSRVEPDTGAFAFTGLLPARYRLRLWMRGGGPVELGFTDLSPGETRELTPRLEAPGRLQVDVEPPPGVPREQVQVMLPVHSLYASNPRTQRRLERDPEGGPFQAHMPGGEYEYSILIDGVNVERRRVHVEAGRITAETVAIPPLVPVTLALQAPRLFLERETFVVLVFTDRFREIPIGRALNGGQDRFEALLPADTTKLLARSSTGLGGEWTSSRAGLRAHEVIPVVVED
jgi:hypothetical protein